MALKDLGFINFKEPFENEVLLFSFTDENRHLMNISLIDGDKSKKFTLYTNIDQVEKVKNFTIKSLM